MAISKIEKEVFEHPSQSKSRCCEEDQLLRRNGYVIHSRPKQGEAIWSKEGQLYKHSEAIRSLRRK